MSKLKILCLHGYLQNANVFKKRTSVLRKALQDIADLDYITAPHDADEFMAKPDQPEDEGQRAWWNAREHPSSSTPEYVGYLTSKQFIQKRLQTHGPYDGVLGFSQGASMAFTVSPFFRCVILISGFPPRDPTTYPHEKKDPVLESSSTSSSLTSSRLEVPSFHVMGETDRMVPLLQSQTLMTYYLNPIVYQHQGGHHVPMDPLAVHQLRQFLTSSAWLPSTSSSSSSSISPNTRP
ncbi:Ovarian cancer-associated protein 2 [Coelomomyces lativittatus]|nr:Ovarian cancer-associated protein 2 [Coelomomyces lativittatus]KAJ1512070.1 Ovarian cancer-associated protein 2 [Coelomomyces lativittatus]